MAPAAQHTISAVVLAAFRVKMAVSIAIEPKSMLGDFASDSQEFDRYVQAFKRAYHQDANEYSKRKVIFERNIELIQTHNSNEHRLWTAEANHLTDRTDEELAQIRGWKRTSRSQGSKQVSLVGEDLQTLRELPDSVDWTSLNMASKVPDQDSCGSCWAVATAAMLHGSYEAQMNGSTRTFSAQQLVSCTPNELDCGGTGGCDGATVELAMEYIDKKGLAEETDIPYKGTNMECPSQHKIQKGHIFLESKADDNVGRHQIGLQSWNKLPENKARPLYEALLQGPVAVSVAADTWSLYGHGVFNGCHKNAVINHAVVLFGYGKESGRGYWKLRNSWGANWGEAGYIKLLRQENLQDDEAYCGYDYDPAAGTACRPYPDKVYVCGMCGIFYDSVSATFGPN